MFQVDETAEQLYALATAEALLGDPVRAHLAKIMLELYLTGRIEVAFNESGEPRATVAELPAPLVAVPLFTDPSLIPPEREAKRQIGFRSGSLN